MITMLVLKILVILPSDVLTLTLWIVGMEMIVLRIIVILLLDAYTDL
jgi:hypothetical protein